MLNNYSCGSHVACLLVQVSCGVGGRRNGGGGEGGGVQFWGVRAECLSHC